MFQDEKAQTHWSGGTEQTETCCYPVPWYQKLSHSAGFQIQQQSQKETLTSKKAENKQQADLEVRKKI